jgi:hypothetical protein
VFFLCGFSGELDLISWCKCVLNSPKPTQGDRPKIKFNSVSYFYEVMSLRNRLMQYEVMSLGYEVMSLGYEVMSLGNGLRS